MLRDSTTTTTTKSLQSCPTLCDPTDGIPSGSTILGTVVYSNDEQFFTEAGGGGVRGQLSIAAKRRSEANVHVYNQNNKVIIIIATYVELTTCWIFL